MSANSGLATRKAFGQAIRRLGELNPQVVVLDADLSKSTQSESFKNTTPERFIQMGIAEANMISTAAGLALSGFKPFACSFAAFISGRFDQIKMSVAYSGAPVRIVGTHAGVGIGPDGYSQQGLEDLALMRSLPTMNVLQPADDIETAQMVEFLIHDDNPAYLRLTRQDLPRVHNEDYRFSLGKFSQLLSGNDVAIFATGGTVGNALKAGIRLHKIGIAARVINASSIKPVDENCIVAAANETKGIVSVEDHTVLGGLGGAIAEVVAEKAPAKMLRIGLSDVFGESGSPEELYRKHELDEKGIFDRVRTFVGA